MVAELIVRLFLILYFSTTKDDAFTGTPPQDMELK